MSDYDLKSYGRMLTHEARMDAYVKAIEAAVRPGDTVLELGTGTGVMALLACRQGAKHVYALEPAETIVIARRTAQDNGCADRITFLREFSTKVELPEKCDVLISDLRGAMPCFQTHLADLIDARARLLKADARWICQTDTLFAAVAQVTDRAHQVNRLWDGSAWGLDLRAALPYAANQPARHPAKPEERLSPARSWARIDYPRLTSPHVRGSARLEVDRAGTGDGVLVWFAAELFGGAAFSDAPGQPPGPYVPMLLPWPESVPLQAGDVAEVKIDLVFSGHDYWWNWTTRIHRDGATDAVAAFKQSTLQGQILDRPTIAAHAGSFAPTRSGAGDEVLFVLQRMDGQTTQSALASALRAQFPGRYSDEAAAMARVSRIRTEFGP